MTKDLIVDTKMLAAFANLEPADADHFRNAVAPGFVPKGWWTALALKTVPGATSTAMWQTEQERLRDAWRSQFPPAACVDLIVSAAKMSEHDIWMQEFNERMTKSGIAEAMAWNAKREIPKPEIYPYQHVIMRLALQPWRARICEICGQFFVKDFPRDRYCSSACTTKARLASKRSYWDSNKSKLRPSKNKKKRGGK